MTSQKPTGPARLTLIVITRNEAHNLPRCLESARWADEIVVVDSGSSDATVDIAQQYGAHVASPPDWPGFGAQKNRALDVATGDWVLSLDADEWLSPELADEIRAVLRGSSSDATEPLAGGAASGAVVAYAVPRLSAFCGQWMHHSGWYPDRVARLFKRGQARFSADLVHERLVVDGVTRSLQGHLFHDSIPSLDSAIDKMNRYSSGRAQDLRARGRRGGLARALAHGCWTFVRTYVLRRGFLDGSLGFVLAVHNAETTYYRYLKMWLDERPSELSPPPSVQNSWPFKG